MLMPDKHVRFAESLIGVGGIVLDCLSRPMVIDELWAAFKKKQDSGTYAMHTTFEAMVLAVDALYAIGAILENPKSGALVKCA